MSPTCPDGFDHHTWEKIVKRSLNDTFLLHLAKELEKSNCCVDDICDCLSLNRPGEPMTVEGQTNEAKTGYAKYLDILTEWQRTAHEQNKDKVGDLVGCLSRLPLRDICRVLSDFCCEFFKLKGTVTASAITVYFIYN